MKEEQLMEYDILCYIKTSYGHKQDHTRVYSQYAIYDFEMNQLITKTITWEKKFGSREAEFMALRVLLNYLDTMHFCTNQNILVLVDNRVTLTDLQKRMDGQALYGLTKQVEEGCIEKIEALLTANNRLTLQHLGIYNISQHFNPKGINAGLVG